MKDNLEEFSQDLSAYGEKHLSNSESSETEDLEDHEIFEILGNSRRLFVIQFMDEYDEPYELRNVSEALGCIEEGIEDPAKLGYDARKRARVALYQTHMPRLKDFKAVEYDRINEIYKGDNFSTFSNYTDPLFVDHENTEGLIEKIVNVSTLFHQR